MVRTRDEQVGIKGHLSKVNSMGMEYLPQEIPPEVAGSAI